MIPKKIHYCWFGKNEKSKLVQKCIASWKKYMPDYEIVEWNEDSFDIDQHPYLRWCYNEKKWAFLSDFARLLIVEENGGVYFDTDVEVVSNIDHLLKYEAFYGFENDENIATGLGFGAQAHHISVQAMINQYISRVPDKEGYLNLEGCPKLNTQALDVLGLEHTGKFQIVRGAAILPADYLNPYDDHTGRLNRTDNTVAIHWYAKSALSKIDIIRSNITRPIHRLFGVNCFSWIKKV